jgi:hypothetical protein
MALPFLRCLGNGWALGRRLRLIELLCVRFVQVVLLGGTPRLRKLRKMPQTLRFSEHQNRKWEEIVLAAVDVSAVYLLHNQVVCRGTLCLVLCCKTRYNGCCADATRC